MKEMYKSTLVNWGCASIWACASNQTHTIHCLLQIVWRLKVNGLKNIPDNVMLYDWLPQNDLLGHRNTKLFITHCGRNGQFESMYHAVPMVIAHYIRFKHIHHRRAWKVMFSYCFCLHYKF